MSYEFLKENLMTSYHPVNYNIHLEPDLVNFTFVGSVEIMFEAHKATSEIVLNLLEIAVWRCRMLSAADPVDCAFNVDPAKEAGKKSLSIRAGDIHRELGFLRRIPVVCSALRSRKFQKNCDIKLAYVDGTNNTTAATFTYRLKKD